MLQGKKNQHNLHCLFIFCMPIGWTWSSSPNAWAPVSEDLYNTQLFQDMCMCLTALYQEEGMLRVAKPFLLLFLFWKKTTYIGS